MENVFLCDHSKIIWRDQNFSQPWFLEYLHDIKYLRAEELKKYVTVHGEKYRRVNAIDKTNLGHEDM